MEFNTIYGFKEAYEKKHPNGHFFDADTLKFFGERLSEMRLLKAKENVTDICGEKHKCYVISSVQRRSIPGSISKRVRTYHYFDSDTLCQVVL